MPRRDITPVLTSESGSARVRFVPLGGLGEIGMNCLAIEQEDGILVVDCGAGFPSDDRGIDVFHPNFAWLTERKAKISGVFLTHGHEDHIGGLPYLLAELDVPIWGPPHALGLVRRRLLEHQFGADEIDLRPAHTGERYSAGPFSIEPIRVSHSIVEASALCIDTRIGRVLHSGDFNFDPDPPDGEPTDEHRLRELGDEGIAVLLSDSTNSDLAERVGSERAVGASVASLVAAAPKRVVIALFASNVQRLILLGEIARRSGRKICLFGRSLETQFTIASEIGRLRWPSDLRVSADVARELPREELMVLAGGTQAERNSALKRLSLGTHHLLTLEAGDTVVLSSRAIPGNERTVDGMINDLLRADVVVHSRVTDPTVHTSGHAGRSEQRKMIELCRPRCFVPVHGTLHHMRRHATLADELGVGRIEVVENGTPVVCDGNSVFRGAEVPHGKVAIAMGGELIEEGTLQARTDLSRTGIAVVCLVVDRKGGVLAPPEVLTRGVPSVDGQLAALRAIAQEATRAADAFQSARGGTLEDFVRRAARRKLEDLSGTRPVVEVTVVRMES